MEGSSMDAKAGKKAGKAAAKEVIVFSIFRTHIKRIGFIRTFAGGGMMYVSILEFIFIHLTGIFLLYQWMLVPFFKVKKFSVKDYIHLDRSRVEGMTLFDIFNCQFCAYANGSTKLWNDQLDEIAKGELGKGNILAKLIVALFSIFMMCFIVTNYIFSRLLYLVISLFLGYHRISVSELKNTLVKRNYASGYRAPMRWIIFSAKVYAMNLTCNLEQIESSWCPLKHLEDKKSVFPDHHSNFYHRDEFGKVLEVLAKEGTVSPLKPKY